MDVIFLIYVFVLGTLVGSFVHVVATRYNTGMSPLKGRSMCFSCGKTLAWYELIPIVSFIIQKGTCSQCKTKISWQYPLVECIMGLVFVGIAVTQYTPLSFAINFPHSLFVTTLFFVYYAVVFSILMIIVVYDIRHTIIPNVFVYTFAILAVGRLLLSLYTMGSLDAFGIADLVAPLVLSIPFALLWLISGGRWIGLGDAKMTFGIGALLGFVSGVSAVILAFWIGATYGIYLIVRSHLTKVSRTTLSSEVPFAPFLAIATFIVFVTRIDLLQLQSFLSLL